MKTARKPVEFHSTRKGKKISQFIAFFFDSL